MNVRAATLLFALSLSSTLFLGGPGGCGGGGGGGGSSAGDVTSASDISNLPSLDVSDYDLTGSDAAALKASHVPVGEFSMAGCESDRHKNEMIRMTKALEGTQCMVKKAGELGVITVPTNSFAYYNFTPPTEGPEEPPALKGIGEGGPEDGPPEGEFESMEIKARVGLFCENDAGETVPLDGDGGCPATLRFKMDQCENGSLGMEMRYAIAGGRYNGTVIHQFSHEGGDERGRITLDVNTSPTGGFDFTSALITGTFNGVFGQGALSFAADADLLTNTVQGAFTSSFTDPTGHEVLNTGTVASRWAGLDGCAAFEGTGEFPAMTCPYEDWVPAELQGEACCILPSDDSEPTFAAANEDGNCEFNFADTEPFLIVLEGDAASNWLVAETNDFCGEVEALDGLTPDEIAFADNWNCEPPTGEEFQRPDFSAIDPRDGDPFRECFEDEMASEDARQSICMQDFGSEKRDERREEEGPGGPEPVAMSLAGSSGCSANAMPEEVKVFVGIDHFGVDADINGDGVTEPIGGGQHASGTINSSENGYDPNGGDHEDGHHGCSGTVSESGLTVSGCADGCSFSYAP